jgi:hypothetical protein
MGSAPSLLFWAKSITTFAGLFVNWNFKYSSDIVGLSAIFESCHTLEELYTNKVFMINPTIHDAETTDVLSPSTTFMWVSGSFHGFNG